MIWKGDCVKKVPEGEESEERASEWGRPRQPSLRDDWGASRKMREGPLLDLVRTCSLAASEAAQGDWMLCTGHSISAKTRPPHCPGRAEKPPRNHKDQGKVRNIWGVTDQRAFSQCSRLCRTIDTISQPWWSWGQGESPRNN